MKKRPNILFIISIVILSSLACYIVYFQYKIRNNTAITTGVLTRYFYAARGGLLVEYTFNINNKVYIGSIYSNSDVLLGDSILIIYNIDTPSINKAFKKEND